MVPKYANTANESRIPWDYVNERFSYDPISGIMRHRYTKKPLGWSSERGYIRTNLKGCYVFVHRVIWFLVHKTWPSDQIDHIDGDGSNNRLSNLREATAFENLQNRKGAASSSTTGYRGVTETSRGFRAQVRANGSRYDSKYFKTAEEAFIAAAKIRSAVHSRITTQDHMVLENESLLSGASAKLNAVKRFKTSATGSAFRATTV